MQNSFTKIGLEKEYELQFSICTIVSDLDEYALMKNSFENAGFTNDCEYIIADNTQGNIFDGYSAIRRFLQEAKATYTIIVHQDVRCEDNIGVLKSCLQLLNEKDENWAVCGNAGGIDYRQVIFHLNNNGDVRKTPGLPLKVNTLDENLLIIKTNALLTVSADVKTFHFYATDICIIADLLGYTAYVIPFMVQHLSKGNLTDMEQKKPFFIEKYGYKLRARFIQTTCTTFYIGKSIEQTRLLNSKRIFFWVKALRRFKNKFR
ncbi:MAG: hypothetical protein LH615_09330 [Ferruginibacter sp.]|nr:hypothetical protein [Ferruginibacter sp.]